MILFDEAIEKNSLMVINYGGGVNSKSVLAALYEKWVATGDKKKYRPGIIVFADTGGETPDTYADIVATNNWLFSIGWPQIDVVRAVDKQGIVVTLEGRCLSQGMLPSKVYGSGACSERHKIKPVTKFLNNLQLCKDVWGDYTRLNQITNKVTKVIGIDFGESHRANTFISGTSPSMESERAKFDVVFPLIDWEMDREDCVKAIERVGLAVPPKSSCFFCPSMKKEEIRRLGAKHPDLLARALIMEEVAIGSGNLTSVKGLGRNYSWSDVVKDDFIGSVGDSEPCLICSI